jgi:uncharacterized protein (DUF2141 family)
MKQKVKLYLLIGIMAGASTAAQAQSKVVAQINNIRNDKGVCRVCLFDNAAAFKGESGTPLQCLQPGVKGGASEAVFENVRPGVYAIAVFHDANKNNKMDTNLFGIPKEGYGASGNKLPFASAPGFDENKFTVGDKTTTTLRIRLRNL